MLVVKGTVVFVETLTSKAGKNFSNIGVLAHGQYSKLMIFGDAYDKYKEDQKVELMVEVNDRGSLFFKKDVKDLTPGSTAPGGMPKAS